MEKTVDTKTNDGGYVTTTYTDGSWDTRKKDRWGNEIWYTDSTGYWRRERFNAKGEVIYSEDSINGY